MTGKLRSADMPLPDALVGRLLEAAVPTKAVALADARRDLMRRVAVDVPLLTVRRGEGRWKRWLKGVERMVLSSDGRTETWLARLAPGASLPPHDHAEGDEECLVLEGSCLLDGIEMHAGDYQLAPKGSRHELVLSPGGCILFLRSPVMGAEQRATPA